MAREANKVHTDWLLISSNYFELVFIRQELLQGYKATVIF